MEEQKSNPGIKWAKWLVLAIGIAILAVVWILNGGLKQTPSPSPSSFPNATSSTSTNNAAVPPQPRSAVNIKAESGKFVPDSFTAQKGKVLTINLTAVDNTYDFGFEDPKLGFDVIVKKGETKSFGFDTSDKKPGDYKFHCIQYCPKTGMEGVLTIQ